jgi:ribosomal protein S18 acetylase RimI-like enzyme
MMGVEEGMLSQLNISAELRCGLNWRMGEIEFRKLNEGDAAAYWSLRDEALEREPLAFGKAVEEHRATTVEEWAARFREYPERSFTLGGFDCGVLTGIATFIREQGLKERHKGHIYGVYVGAAHRQRGFGHAMIAAVVNIAKEDVTLEQILLAVGTCQEVAMRMYRASGFEVYGTEPRALKVGSRYVDEHQMILRVR